MGLFQHTSTAHLRGRRCLGLTCHPRPPRSHTAPARTTTSAGAPRSVVIAGRLWGAWMRAKALYKITAHTHISTIASGGEENQICRLLHLRMPFPISSWATAQHCSTTKNCGNIPSPGLILEVVDLLEAQVQLDLQVQLLLCQPRDPGASLHKVLFDAWLEDLNGSGFEVLEAHRQLITDLEPRDVPDPLGGVELVNLHHLVPDFLLVHHGHLVHTLDVGHHHLFDACLCTWFGHQHYLRLLHQMRHLHNLFISVDLGFQIHVMHAWPNLNCVVLDESVDRQHWHAHRHLHDFLLLLNTPPDLRHGSLPDSLLHNALINHFTAPFGYHLQLLLYGDLRNVNILLHHPRINFWNLPNDLVVVVFGHLHCDGFLVDVRNINNPFLDIHPHPLKEPFHLLRQDDVFFTPCRPARGDVGAITLHRRRRRPWDDDVATPGSKVRNRGEERVSEVPTARGDVG